MRYTLRHLQVFLAVAHHESVSEAAEDLALSQSAVSTALKEFERRMDISLFDRIGKRLQLSELGTQVRPKAESLLAQAQELERILSSHNNIGDIKVGATLTIGNYLAVEIMARFMAQHPGTRVELTVENTQKIAHLVANFELDIGLVEGELQDPDLEILPWRQDELTLFCAPENSLAKSDALTDQDLLQAHWIVRETGSGTRQAFDRAMGGILPNLKLRLELQHTEAIKRAVQANLGIGCLSKLTLQDPFRRGDLVELAAPHRNWRRSFYFVLHRQKYHSGSIESWMNLCRA